MLNPDDIPFSFNYNGEAGFKQISQWTREVRQEQIDADKTLLRTVWQSPDGLKLTWEATRFDDFAAVEWVFYLENTGTENTGIISDFQSLRMILEHPMAWYEPFLLHKTKGSFCRPDDFEPSVVGIRRKNVGTFQPENREVLGGREGRSSNKDLPFFKVETGAGSFIIAVGWSGQWQSIFETPDDKHLHIQAGMEKTHFRLYPGEKVRMPRILVFYWPEHGWGANAEFRRLIYKHYCPKRSGKDMLPVFYCNTAFTRGGGWLNQTNAENQISLIKAYAPLGIEALLTDAGWFEGGWPAGAGNWTPRKDAYPEGMAPVAKAALENNMVYGLWFEIERVFPNTSFHLEHPDWVLWPKDMGDKPGQIKGLSNCGLANFGLPQVQDHFFNIVNGFMKLPGFGFYRQDFNMEPLDHWRDNDAPDRQGITEMKYIEGLYAYWDRLAQSYPDAVREGCAAGGRRIDLEAIMRMQIHQKSDFWFDNTVDQAMTWGLSQYLPNNLLFAPIMQLDDYSFHSVLAGSVCLGWITDDPKFDMQKAEVLLEQYKAVRHCLVGGWYPLLPYSRDETMWCASQYHRRDLNEGVVIVFRRPQSPITKATFPLNEIDPSLTYELTIWPAEERRTVAGTELINGINVELKNMPDSTLIWYRKK